MGILPGRGGQPAGQRCASPTVPPDSPALPANPLLHRRAAPIPERGNYRSKSLRDQHQLIHHVVIYPGISITPGAILGISIDTFLPMGVIFLYYVYCIIQTRHQESTLDLYGPQFDKTVKVLSPQTESLLGRCTSKSCIPSIPACIMNCMDSVVVAPGLSTIEPMVGVGGQHPSKTST